MAMRVREEDCTNCRLCVEVCPVDAIQPPGGLGACYRILADRCTECAGLFLRPRCAEVCPVAAIETDPDHLESMETLTRKWHAHALAVPWQPGHNGAADLGDPDA